MKIHEYQGKEIFRSFNIPVPIGYAVNKLDDVEKVIKKVQNESKKDAVVVKAQIHAGGRGKGGGVKFSSDLSTAVNNANKIFGMNLKIENLKLESSDFGIDTWKVVLFESIFLRK